MSKCVNKGARIILGGSDITDHVNRWAVIGEIGQLYEAEIDILDDPRVITIEQTESCVSVTRKPETAVGGCKVAHRGLRVAKDDVIQIKGEDISRWISRYDRISRVGNADTIRLYVQCDRDVLSINGTHPWEDQI